MGSQPSAPTQEQAEALRNNVEAACQAAAHVIGEADVLLLCTGAGFSADSGLAVYADVAKVDAYAKRGLKYHDICQPHWLQSEPDLFWGFWGQCFNDYRDTPPHEGFAIIEKWVERRFRHSELAQVIRQKLGASPGRDPYSHEQSAPSGQAPYRVTDFAGAFFVFTSNVDAHHFDWFRACEIRECHGNTEIYQCADRCAGIWRAPLDFRFCVDTGTMLAPAGNGAEGAAPTDAAAEAEGGAATPEVVSSAADDNAPEKPRIGHVRGGGRTTTLRHMPGVPTEVKGFDGNHPMCPTCGGPARPAILMFGDADWQDIDEQEERWGSWTNAVARVVKSAGQDGGRQLRVAIIEIGAGGNVPTVRRTSEKELRRFREHGASAKLIRVNPDLPLGDSDEHAPEGHEVGCIISVMDRGLASIRRIDAAMEALLKAKE